MWADVRAPRDPFVVRGQPGRSLGLDLSETVEFVDMVAGLRG